MVRPGFRQLRSTTGCQTPARRHPGADHAQAQGNAKRAPPAREYTHAQGRVDRLRGLGGREVDLRRFQDGVVESLPCHKALDRLQQEMPDAVNNSHIKQRMRLSELIEQDRSIAIM
jgi:hypothetical protein